MAATAANGNEISNNTAAATFAHNLVKGEDVGEAVKGTSFTETPGCVFTTTSPFASTTTTDTNFLRLLALSGAAQRGDNSRIDWDTDLDGNDRIRQYVVDMGAYEGVYAGDLIYVVEGGAGTKDGTTWGNAFDSLHLAIAAGRSADLLLVKGGGLFHLQPHATSIKARTRSFTPKVGMRLYGGFLGTETGTAEEMIAARPKNFVKDTLSGAIGTETDDKVYHVVSILEDKVVLDGFAIRDGKANGASADSYNNGAGVYMIGNSMLRNLDIHGNAAEGGGGINLSAGTLTHSHIHDNTATSDGAGLRVVGGRVLNNLIYNNSCSGSAGGGFSFGKDAQIIGNTIYGNRVNHRGGGIALFASLGKSSRIANNIIYGNTAGTDVNGHEVHNSSAEVRFAHNLVKGAGAESAIRGTPFIATPGCVFTLDELFASTTTTDSDFLRLNASAQGVQAGDNSQVTWAKDLGGDDRIQGNYVDIGAYETDKMNSIYYVAEEGAGEKDGSSWANALDSLHLALNQAVSRDTILVKGGGLFKTQPNGTSVVDRTKSFVIDRAIPVYGGFAGTETGTAEEIIAARPVGFAKDTLSGDIGTVGTDSDNSYHVVSVSAYGAVLDGFAIRDGHANGSSSDHYDKGAGVYVTADATLRHIEAYDCRGVKGGGVYLSAGTLTHSVIYDNTTTSVGAGVYTGGTAKVINCVIYGNDCGISVGGGIVIDNNSSVHILNNTLYGNASPKWKGGGLAIEPTNGAKNIVANNLIYGNRASNDDRGHEVYNQAAGVIFEHNLVKGADAAAAIKGTAFSATPNCVFTTTSPFANTTVGNQQFLRLGTGSEAIDAGDNRRATWANDLTGKARIQGSAVDIGAYEYEGTGARILNIVLSASSVAHLTAADVKIADLSATHIGLGTNPTITYTIKDADATADTFKIVGTELKTNKAINYGLIGETHSPITIVATHTPTGGEAIRYEKEVTITITITDKPTSPLAIPDGAEVYAYPNPTSGLLHLHSTEKVKRLRLLDTSGKRVLRHKGADALDLSGLAAGAYLLEVVTPIRRIRIPVLKD